MKKKKNKYAVALGKLSGKKNKEKGREYFVNLSKLGVEARKNKPKKLSTV